MDQNSPPFWNNISSGGQIEFQVEALIGHIGRTVGFASWYFDGEESGWSNTQIVTVPAVETSPAPTVTTSASAPIDSGTQATDLVLLVVVVAAVIVIAVIIVATILVRIARKAAAS